jgi:hypothetical protein
MSREARYGVKFVGFRYSQAGKKGGDRSKASPRAEALIKDTAHVRQKLLEIWRLVEKKEMSASEARFHISRARAVLETLKVEIAAAHQDPHGQG